MARGKRVNSCQKGKRVERALAAFIRDHGFLKARRGQQYKGTDDSADVVDAIPGVHCESKGVKSSKTLHKWMEKCEAECAADEDPAVFIKANGKRWLVTLDAKDYLDLMAELIERREHAKERTTEASHSGDVRGDGATDHSGGSGGAGVGQTHGANILRLR